MDLKISILFSGNGTNMIKIIDSCIKKKISAKVVLIICDNPNAPGLAKLKKYNIKTVILDPKSFKTKFAFQNKIHRKLISEDVNLICLAGFMRILKPSFVKNWQNKIINIHPSLLPAFKGLNAQKQAIDYGVKYSGCTTHYVDNTVDGGPIIEQAIVPIEKKDTVNSLTKKILNKEHEIYISTLVKLSKKR